VILRITRFSILLPLAMVAVICLIGITKVYAFEINTVTIKLPKGASSFDLDYYIVSGDEGVGKVQHNKDAKQNTLNVHKSDFLSGNIHPADGTITSCSSIFYKEFQSTQSQPNI
jgi:hypothetical protein